MPKNRMSCTKRMRQCVCVRGAGSPQTIFPFRHTATLHGTQQASRHTATLCLFVYFQETSLISLSSPPAQSSGWQRVGRASQLEFVNLPYRNVPNAPHHPSPPRLKEPGFSGVGDTFGRGKYSGAEPKKPPADNGRPFEVAAKCVTEWEQGEKLKGGPRRAGGYSVGGNIQIKVIAELTGLVALSFSLHSAPYPQNILTIAVALACFQKTLQTPAPSAPCGNLSERFETNDFWNVTDQDFGVLPRPHPTSGMGCADHAAPRRYEAKYRVRGHGEEGGGRTGHQDARQLQV